MTLTLYSAAPYITSPFEQISKQLLGMPERIENLRQENIRNQYLGQQLAANIQTQRLKNAYQTVLNQNEPELASAELQSKNLLNQHQKLVNQFAPKTLAAQAALQDAQAKIDNIKSTDPALLDASLLSGPAGQEMQLQYIKNKYGANSPQALQAQKLLDAKVTRANAYQFGKMPVSFRKAELGKASSLGYDPTAANRRLQGGGTLDTLAASPHPTSVASRISPTYPAETGTITQLQKQTQASAGLNSLTAFMAKYGTVYGGITSKLTRPWLRDALSTNPANQKKAAYYYAAHAIAPEIAGIRMRMQQGQSGIGAMQELLPTVIGSVRTDLSFAPPKVQKMAIEIATEQFDKAIKGESAQTLSANPAVLQQKSSPKSQSPQFRKNFKDKAEFVNYFNSLSPSQQNEYRAMYGGSK